MNDIFVVADEFIELDDRTTIHRGDIVTIKMPNPINGWPIVCYKGEEYDVAFDADMIADSFVWLERGKLLEVLTKE